jgi:hypothetical protein
MRRRALSDETAGRTVKGWEREVGRANAGLGGNQAFSFIGTAAFSAAGQVRYSQVGDETIIQANTNANTSTIEFELHLLGNLTLSTNGFIL